AVSRKGRPGAGRTGSGLGDGAIGMDLEGPGIGLAGAVDMPEVGNKIVDLRVGQRVDWHGVRPGAEHGADVGFAPLGIDVCQVGTEESPESVDLVTCRAIVSLP